MSVSQLFDQNTLSVFQGYALSSDKTQFLKKLPQGLEKNILNALSFPYTQSLQDKLVFSGVPYALAVEIVQKKLYSRVQQAKSINDIQDIYDMLKNKYAYNADQVQPKEIRSRQQKKGQEPVQQKEDLKKTDSKLELQYFQTASQNLQSILKKDKSKFQVFSPYAMRNLSEQTLLDLDINHKNILISKNLLPTFPPEFTNKFLSKYVEQISKFQGYDFQVPQHIYRTLPTEHLSEIVGKNPQLLTNSQFLPIWFSSTYEKQNSLLTALNSSLTFGEKQEKRKLLQNILNDLEKITSTQTLNCISRQIELQLLLIDIVLEDPDLDRFFKYMEKNNQGYGLVKNSWREGVSMRYLPTTHLLNNLNSVSVNLNSFIQEYVLALFDKFNAQNYKKLDEKLMQIFDDAWYKKLKSKKLLAKGEQQTDKILTQAQKQQIRQKKLLSICKTNKTTFKLEQEVVLKLKIKNIEKLNIKIYELNLEKHYLTNNKKIDDQVDLQHLGATYTSVCEIENSNPYKQQIYDLEIKQIKKQRGVFIVEIHSSGISSRAVIRKGGLFCQTKVTVAGVLATFFQEDGRKIQQLSLWVRGHLVQTKGEYLFPFENNLQKPQVIAIIGDFAQVFDIEIPKQKYNLEIKPYYNKQSFIVGSKAKIILSPRLTLRPDSQKQPPIAVSLKLLKNFHSTVTITDHQNIRSILSYQNLKLNYENDIGIEIPIQSYVKNMEISGSAQITTITGQKQELHYQVNIAIEFKNQDIQQYYLRKVGKQYILYVIGLDGEPKPEFRVTLYLKYRWVENYQQHILTTDSKGQINLGQLKHVQLVFIQHNSRKWEIGTLQGHIQLSNRMCFKEGQIIRIPLPPAPYNLELGSDINLFSKVKETFLNNCNNLIKIKENYLEIIGLTKGIYNLQILSLDYNGSIVVLKGEQWENQNQIYDKESSTIYQFIRNSNNYLTLGTPKIQDSDNGNKKISVKIQKPEGVQINSNIKAHIFAYSFIPTDTLPRSLVTCSLPDIRSKKIKQERNSYYNNKILSEEAAYVLNRKQQKQFVGNNLEKPRILLKNIKVRETVLKDEEMKKQNNFTDRIVNTNNNNNTMDLLGEVPSQPYSVPIQSYSNLSRQNISQHNNFLQIAGLTIQNLKSPTLEFTIPNCYNYISIVLTSNSSQSSRGLLLEDCCLKKKKIRHTGLQKQENQNLSWSMSREIYSLAAGESKKISRNSRWCAVSLSNIFRFVKAKGIQYDDWLEKWGTYSWDFKLEVYNKEICHQLNSYIKHQDLEFFGKVVQPFIKNKINKTFVDLCLIQDQLCQKWVDLSYFNQLNQFQKVLLIEYLAKKQKFQQALVLAKSMELLSKSQKQSYAAFKQKFESMLNADATVFRPDSFKPSMPPPPPPAFGSPSIPVQMFDCFSASPPPPPPQLAHPSFAMSGTTASFGSGYSGFLPPPPPSVGVRPESRGGLFGGMGVHPRNAPNMYANMQMKPMSYQRPEQMIDQERLIEKRTTFVQQFKEVQKTCQYTQITYNKMKDSSLLNKNLLPVSKFWSDLAIYLASGKNVKNSNKQQFISQSILNLSHKLQFNLAISFLPNNLNPDYELSSQSDKVILTANKPFLLLIKQLKQIKYEQKSGIMINHRFINPRDQYIYEEDGSRIEKQVEEFVIGVPYVLQTLVTNTTSRALELQLLVDLPQGSIPLRTKQYTQIINVSIPAYSTQSFVRYFYFPTAGEFSLYPANACWVKNVIAKAKFASKLSVKEKKSSKKMETLMDVLEEGQTDDILLYLTSKNIFDSNMFKPSEILWMLKDKQKYEKITKILRQRGYIDRNILRFGFLHKDLLSIKQYLSLTGNKQPIQQIQSTIKIFQYYPYYSSRAHKYENTAKSKIRNIQFKQTYYRFLLQEIAYHNGSNSPNFKLSLAYFLLLQDRIEEATQLIKNMKEQQEYQLQFDYLLCFLDMYEGGPNYHIARKIVKKYEDYPILSWRALFQEVIKTLKKYDCTVYVEDEEKKIQFRASVINQGKNLRFSIPENHRVQVFFHSINLELAFSKNPSSEIIQGYSVKPAKIVVFEAGQSRQEKIKWEDDLKDVIVEVFESEKSIVLRKIQPFLWTNPKLKVKVNEKTGSLQVFYENKPISGNYCKVYSIGNKGIKFYRDGYTDITGSFRYALSELNQISKFYILCTSENGGIITRAAKPSQSGQFSQM